MAVHPADPWGWLKRITDDIKGLRRDLRELQQARQSYPQKATVTAYTAHPYCTVEFESGETAVVQLPQAYTPAVGHVVAVQCGPYLSVVLFRLA